MPGWLYDVVTQAVAGLVSGSLVGAALLRAQHRLERRLEGERVQYESRRELLAAAFQMYRLVSEAFAATGSQQRVAEASNKAGRVSAEWEAVEAMRQLPDDIVRLSAATRSNLHADLQAIVGMAGLGGEASPEERGRWLVIGKRAFAEPLADLIGACARPVP